MFSTLATTIPKQNELPERAWELDCLRRVLTGKLYDNLAYDFHEEKTAGGEYVLLAKRRPSVRYGLCRLVVDDSVSMLFGEGRFPVIDCENEAIREALHNIATESRLQAVMTDAATRGSVGSVVLLLRILKGRVFVSALDTVYLTPTWDPEEPDVLQKLTERYIVKGRDLRNRGYTVADEDMAAAFWFCREWDGQAETWYLPQKVAEDDQPMQIDTDKTVEHALGFVPAVWVRNLPGSSTDDDADGGCTFRAAIETQIEIEYQLSQAGRGLKYSSDPTLLIKEPAAGEGDMLKSPANALVVAANGDAKLLEIGGTAAAAVIEYVRALREMALESIHGNRAPADRVIAAQSGRAMEMMHQSLIGLCDKLRSSYGQDGLLKLMRMIVRASEKYELIVNGEKIAKLDQNERITLSWGPWFAPTYADKQQQAGTLVSLKNGGLMSRESAVSDVAQMHDIGDVPAELARIKADEAEADQRAAAQAAAVTAAETIEA